MLKKVRIKNFLSCEDTEIEFDNVTALIGRNAAGKTNVLKAILWASNFYFHGLHFSIDPNTEVSIEILVNINSLKYDLKRSGGVIFDESLSYCENNEWVVIAERKEGNAVYYQNGKVIPLTINKSASIILSIITLLPDEDLNPCIRDFLQYCGTIGYYTLENQDENSGGYITFENYTQWLAHKNNSVEMRLLNSWKEDKELFCEIQELLGKNGLDLIQEIKINEHSFKEQNLNISNVLYNIRFIVKNTPLSYLQLSYGTQRVLIILLALLYDKSITLLIEQPEDGIHIGLLRKVLSICFTYAEAYNKQLIITTHSPKVINMFPAKSIRFVKMTEQGTKVTQLSEKELAVVPEYLSNEGTLSDFIEAMDDE